MARTENAVDTDVSRSCAYKVTQKGRFDRRRQFSDVIDGSQAANFRAVQTDVTKAKAPKPLATAVEFLFLIVDQEYREAPVGMMSEE